MKKITFLLLVLLLTTMRASAQQEELKESIGISSEYGTYPESFGFGVRYQHLFGNHLRLAPNFTYYSNMNNKQGWDLCADLHYLIPMKYERLKFYPLAGIGVLSVKYKDGKNAGYSKSGFGINMGGGIQYSIMKHFSVFGETKYHLTSEIPDQLSITAGLAYKF